MYKYRAPFGPLRVSLAARPGTMSSRAEWSTGLNCCRNAPLTAMATPACHLVGPCDQTNLEMVGSVAALACPSVLWVSAKPAKSTSSKSFQACRCEKVTDITDVWGHPLFHAKWRDAVADLALLVPPTRIVVSGMRAPIHAQN